MHLLLSRHSRLYAADDTSCAATTFSQPAMMHATSSHELDEPRTPFIESIYLIASFHRFSRFIGWPCIADADCIGTEYQ